MKKSELKQGALVQMRNGNMYILIGKKFVNLKDGGYMPLEKYNEDLLTCNSIIGGLIYDVVSNSKYDVMKVFNSSFEHEGYHTYINGYPLKWTWERKEEPYKELTVGEIEKLLGYKVKIIKEETNE